MYFLQTPSGPRSRRGLFLFYDQVYKISIPVRIVCFLFVHFKSKGYDIGFECVGGFIDTRMSKTPEEIKALVEDTFMKGQQKTAREEGTRRLEEVFSEPNIGTDTAEIDAVLKALLEPTISELKNVSESMQTHERMREGILPEQTQNENSELEQDEEYESHIPSFPTERD